MGSNQIKLVAFYLPQFHPIPENDEWWGKGFTEWTNVGKAKPLFWGHYQPKVPADLGYYDLRVPETRIAQAQMAKEFGVDAFCYYHYWFGNNRQLLEKPFNEVLDSKEPDFPFMLCWANESWNCKFWNKDGVYKKELLIEQKYLGEADYESHFYYVLKAFKDPRYLKIDNKPVFMIYKPDMFEDVSNFISIWRRLAIENGLEGVFFIGQSMDPDNHLNVFLDKGFDVINSLRLFDPLKKKNVFKKIVSKIVRKTFNLPFICDYRFHYKNFITDFEKNEEVFPTVIPNWDHTPRSGVGGFVLINSTSKFFYKHLCNAFNTVINKNERNQVIFIKSWNEWGEGNYLEPDLKYGKSLLDTIQKVRKEFEKRSF